MLTITRYECEICGARYVEEHNAHRCEARGVPALPTWGQLPLLFGNRDDDRWGRITFVLLSAKPRGHGSHALAWAARDTGAGDNRYAVPEQPGPGTPRPPWWLECCPGDWWNSPQFGNPDTGAPHFQRAVEFCRTFLHRHDSEIHVRQGREIVPVSTLKKGDAP